LGIVIYRNGCFERLVVLRILQPPITVSAVRPWRSALQRQRCLPSSLGPVLLEALRRLAAICRNELMGTPPEKLASFRHLKRRQRLADLLRLHHAYQPCQRRR
jgi:hypothetical protein